MCLCLLMFKCSVASHQLASIFSTAFINVTGFDFLPNGWCHGLFIPTSTNAGGTHWFLFIETCKPAWIYRDCNTVGPLWQLYEVPDLPTELEALRTIRHSLWPLGGGGGGAIGAIWECLDLDFPVYWESNPLKCSRAAETQDGTSDL